MTDISPEEVAALFAAQDDAEAPELTKFEEAADAVVPTGDHQVIQHEVQVESHGVRFEFDAGEASWTQLGIFGRTGKDDYILLPYNEIKGAIGFIGPDPAEEEAAEDAADSDSD